VKDTLLLALLTEELFGSNFFSPAPVISMYNIAEEGVRHQTKIDKWPHLASASQFLKDLY
jgi:hypothetical protein